MEQPKPLEIEQAALPGLHLMAHGLVESAVLAAEAAEGPHQRHVGDDVDHLAVNRGCLVCEVVMQGLAGVGKVKQRDDQDRWR